MTVQQTTFKMQPVNHILVCLDLTDIDPYVIKYGDFMAKTLSARQVTFFHAIQAYDLPDRTRRDFPDVETELKEIIHDELYRSVDSHFEEECRWEIVTPIGYEDAAVEMTDYIKNNDVDLTLIGQKAGETRKARYGKKVAAEAASDILFVPQFTEPVASSVLCAIDFSKESGKAFERALDISRTAGAAMSCYFVSDPSRAYFPASTERSSRYYQQQSQKICNKFLKKYGLTPEDVPCRIEASDSLISEAENIYEAAAEKQARIIVVGAQGNTFTVTSLLGNLCESFHLMEKQIPVMIVKHTYKKKFSWLWKKL